MHVMTCHVGNINSRRDELRRQNGFGKQAIFLNRVPRQATCPYGMDPYICGMV